MPPRAVACPGAMIAIRRLRQRLRIAIRRARSSGQMAGADVERPRATKPAWTGVLHRPSVGAVIGRTAFPLKAFALTIAYQEQPAARAAECRNARTAIAGAGLGSLSDLPRC